MFHAPFWLVLIIAGVSCNGGTWLDTSCLVTNVRNFPNERGTVVGLLKSCVGEQTIHANSLALQHCLLSTRTGSYACKWMHNICNADTIGSYEHSWWTAMSCKVHVELGCIEPTADAISLLAVFCWQKLVVCRSLSKHLHRHLRWLSGAACHHVRLKLP